MSNDTFNKLSDLIQDRMDNADPEKSYVANLVANSPEKVCKKIGEEASEVIISALSETNDRLVSEAADLIFHLLVLLKSKNIEPEDVLKELEDRMGISGLDEKAARIAKEKGKFNG